MMVIVSESELKLQDNYYEGFDENQPSKFNELLHELGCDINKPIEKQENVTHRNRLNQVVTCSRWIATERFDKEWINSGYASRDAKNRASGSKMVYGVTPFLRG